MQKSLIPAALILGICLVVAAAIVRQDATPDVRPDTPAVGRFQLLVNTKHPYVIDTATGRIWEGGIITESSGTKDANFTGPKLEDAPH